MKKLIALVALAACLLVVSCEKKDPAKAAVATASKKLFTETALTTADMLARTADPNLGFIANNPEWQALSYAEVNEAQLTAAMSRYRQWLFDKNIKISEVKQTSGWNPRFNCALFAEALVVFMGLELYDEKFQSWSEVVRPAAFVVHYRPEWASKPHAIVQVVCAGRSFYIEPQDTRGFGEVKLTPAEVKSIYRRRG